MPKKATEAAATPKKPAAKRTVTRRKQVEAVQATGPNRDDVATRAYYIHLEEGGNPLENWLRAERELVAV